MGDPHNRKNLAVNRLRNQLRKKKESLADQFEFKMYIVFHFKEKVNPFFMKTIIKRSLVSYAV